jgi:hypothetical protein
VAPSSCRKLWLLHACACMPACLLACWCVHDSAEPGRFGWTHVDVLRRSCQLLHSLACRLQGIVLQACDMLPAVLVDPSQQVRSVLALFR